MSSTKPAIVFPGQGSQRSGMLDDLPSPARVSRLLDAAEALSGLDLTSIAAMAPPEELADTRVAQPLLYLADWAWGSALIEGGVEPTALAGHSLGEFAALAIAGVFSVEAGLELVVERSRLMAEVAAHEPGTMAAVIGLDRVPVTEALDGVEDVWVANDNCPGQVVISGTTDAVASVSDRLAEAGARRVIPLAVSGAFHTPLMSDAADAFSRVLDQAHLDDATIPVVQNSEPAATGDAAVIRERLRMQMTSPVRWTETMQALSAMGCSLLIEAGPGDVLTGLAKRAEGVAGISVSVAGLDAVYEEVAR